MAVSVNADVRRIAQALTLPEYLEAWLCLPDRGAESRLVASQSRDGFRVDDYYGDRLAVRIIASYCFRHQRKMRLLWRKVCEWNLSESVVDFRVRGNFGASVLELYQTGFDSAGEYLWACELWRASLAKLASLFLPPPSRVGFSEVVVYRAGSDPRPEATMGTRVPVHPGSNHRLRSGEIPSEPPGRRSFSEMVADS